jgi:peptide/histidine transporter 3/4
MASQMIGACLIIVYALCLHFNINNLLAYANIAYIQPRYLLFSIQGVVYIFYPVIGIIADIKLTRYRMICLSFWITFVLHIILLLGPILSYATAERNDIVPLFQMNIRDFCLSVTVGLTFIGATCAKGMFESTAIQFGIDQMIGASSSQISTFIHWYYWSLHVGPVFYHFTICIIGYYLSKCHFDIQLHMVDLIVFVQCIIECLLCLVMIPLLYLSKIKAFLNIEPAGLNPYKNIIDVLKFAYKHKYPVNRSALTYYRNTYLSRIDFGKVQYGGPFTNDQVESTKTVFRLSILMLSLIGFNFIRDGFSISGHIMKKTCPSSMVLYIFISNPLLISDIITTLAIPTFISLRKLPSQSTFQTC